VLYEECDHFNGASNMQETNIKKTTFLIMSFLLAPCKMAHNYKANKNADRKKRCSDHSRVKKRVGHDSRNLF